MWCCVRRVLERCVDLLALVVVGLQIDLVDDGLTRSSNVVAREADFVALQQVLVIVVGSKGFQFVLDDELIHAVLGIERKVRSALVEEDAELVAGDHLAVDHQLLIFSNVAIGQTDVA